MENFDLDGFAAVWSRVTEAKAEPAETPSPDIPPAERLCLVNRADTTHAVRFIPQI